MTASGSFVRLTSLFLWSIVQLTSLTPSSSVDQWSFLSVNVGDNVTLPCFYKDDVAVRLFWYKQHMGQKPVLISTFFKYNVDVIFNGEFNRNPRFILDHENGKNDLKIINVRALDSANYYCLRYFSNELEFLATITVVVMNSDLIMPALVHQSVSGSIQPGGSVTLNCTVQTGNCDGQHSVYWFKDSGEAHPRVIYTHGERNDQCERKPDTRTHTCVYNVQINHVDRSDAGNYYCAVASCGHILFGNGTKLDFKDEGSDHVWVYVLSGALTFTTLVVVILTFLYKTKNFHTTETQTAISAPSTTKPEIYDDDDLQYAAVSVNLSTRSRTQRNNMPSECVYSSMKQ
ncbi:uncharacterized protein LOC114844139 [Betta splendens]|uniref:Uncharacterized protein LOC114844139 n=1 Tax=Betta splendens TaxID=158456 RepID=A0A6P7KX78_BETSP|nr:uncharacterized protein LOC114844139 [Betta splendens]